MKNQFGGFPFGMLCSIFFYLSNEYFFSIFIIQFLLFNYYYSIFIIQFLLFNFYYLIFIIQFFLQFSINFLIASATKVFIYFLDLLF